MRMNPEADSPWSARNPNVWASPISPPRMGGRWSRSNPACGWGLHTVCSCPLFSSSFNMVCGFPSNKKARISWYLIFVRYQQIQADKFVKDFLQFCWSLIPFSVIYLDNCLRSSPWKFVFPWFESIGPLFWGKCHLWKFILIICL